MKKIISFNKLRSFLKHLTELKFVQKTMNYKINKTTFYALKIILYFFLKLN